MIKLFTDKSYLTPQNRAVVFPLLFDLWYLPNANLLDKYQLVDTVQECDIAILPVDLAHYREERGANEFITIALNSKKIVWVYTAGDYGQTIDKPVFTFRNGGFDSKLSQNTVLLPSFINDPLLFLEEDFKPLPKPTLPQIGFVGHANNSVQKLLKERMVHLKYQLDLFCKILLTDSQKFYPSSIKRFQLLQRLEKDKTINTDFVLRKKYHTDFKSPKDKIIAKVSFFKNMQSNPYIFCLRGAGNFSVRFYETLAMGRIPFVIDTDFRLPLSQIINWNEHCVFASEEHAEIALVAFHNSISPQAFIQMQIDNRKLWVSFLEREAYFIKLYSNFKEMLHEI